MCPPNITRKGTAVHIYCIWGKMAFASLNNVSGKLKLLSILIWRVSSQFSRAFVISLVFIGLNQQHWWASRTNTTTDIVVVGYIHFQPQDPTYVITENKDELYSAPSNSVVWHHRRRRCCRLCGRCRHLHRHSYVEWMLCVCLCTQNEQ